MMLPLLGVTLFVSAFLLFCCEPMVGKMVLPILGGAASVWTTCVLFFQFMLLAGYVYTHFLGKLNRIRDQIFIHIALMMLALAFLPIRFGAVSGDPSESPVLWLLGHLLVAIGVPFAVISATAPLLQNWLAKTRSAFGRDPYFLYAASNFGSLLALIAYPLVFEPRYGVSGQSRLWLDGYGLLLAMVGFAAVLIWKESRYSKEEADSVVEEPVPTPTWRTRGHWLAAAFVPSALMLAVTNHISLNIGSIPFLWVIPLAVYLLTFIMAFAQRIRLSTAIVSSMCTVVLLVLFPIAAVGVLPMHTSEIWKLITAHIAILFFGGLLCHSSLADSRPSTKYLTEFYFVVALGGVLGGIFTAIIAPAIFKTVFEYPLLVAMVAFFRKSQNQDQKVTWKDAMSVGVFALLVAGAWSLIVDGALINVANFGIAWNDIKNPDNINCRHGSGPHRLRVSAP